MSTKIIDTATPFLTRIYNNNPNWIDKATKSAGWWLRKEIKEGIREEAPGGDSYTPYSDVTKSGMLDAMRGRTKVKSGKRYRAPRRYHLNKEHKPMGRLYSATRYRFYSDSHRALVGWINRSAERLGTMQEKGTKIKVTEKMRRFFFAAGFGMKKSTKYIKIPARPTIEPEYKENMDYIPQYMAKKIFSYMERDSS